MATTESQQQNANQPNYICKAASEMAPLIRYVRDVNSGTLPMRELGKRYLPREEAESDRAYDIRLSRALLVNFYARALNSLVGMVFQEEPELSNDVPEIMAGREEIEANPATDTTPAIAARPEVEGQLEDCDLNGTHWAVFAKELFKDALNDGHSFLLTEMPPALEEGATRADEIAANRRPYWVKYKADQALNWRLDSRGTLQQITFEECSLEPDGEYGETEVYRYRVLRPGSWELFKKVKGDDGQSIIVPDPDTPSGITSLDKIPLSVCYGRYIAPMVSRPSLLDLAVVNVAHYNESSDYRVYLHICSRPAWWARNRDKTGNNQVISPYTFIDVGTDGEVGVAETSGAALSAARTDLKDLEEYMGLLGLQMLNQQTPQKTATEERGDQVRELSELATAAQSLHDCLESALGFWAEYLGLPSGGSVEIGVKSEHLMGDAAARVFLDAAGSVFSRATVRKILAKAYSEFIPEDYTEVSEDELFAKEAAEMPVKQSLKISQNN